MRASLERHLAASTAADRCLLALGLSSPFLLVYFVLHLWGLGVPAIREGVNPGVLAVLQVVLGLALTSAVALVLWLWPRRHGDDPQPVGELLCTLNIGLAHSCVLIAAGTFTAGPGFVLLGELIVGLLLFTRRTMVIVFLTCVALIGLADLGVLLGLWPYAPAIRAEAFPSGQAAWWFEFWRSMVLYVGAAVVVALILVLFWRLDGVHARLNHLSMTDALTGLANRRHFMDRLAQEFLRQAQTGRPLSVVLIDADHFKQVNDRHGHPVGDEVLQALASALALGVRSPTDVAARLGGEEFALLLPETAEAAAAAVCERLREALGQRQFASPEGVFRVTVSMGLVESVASSAQAVLAAADANLYEAKATGRNRVVASRLVSGGSP